MISRLEIAGIPLWYERDVLPRMQSFRFDPKFFRLLEECFIEIGEAFKPLSRVISAGAYVDKPGAHKLGRAFDLDGIEFEDGQIWMATEQTRLTAAIQGVFMKKFGTVLGWTYDEAHRDHLHISDWGPPWGFRDYSRAVVSYVQWVLNLGRNLEGGLAVDGIWGPKTEVAFWFNFGKPTHVGLPENVEYRTFLDFATQRFFSQMRREKAPEGVKDEKTCALERIRDIVAMALQEGDRG